MLKKILVSLFLVSLIFTFSACTKKGDEKNNDVDNNVVSQEKIDEVNNQKATLTPEEERLLEEQADQQEVIDNKWISFSEVAKHNTASDCWLIINDRVYDVTKAVGPHPGGQAILAGCGKNATEMFFKRQDGTAHSEKAQSMLDKYYIGDRNMKE